MKNELLSLSDHPQFEFKLASHEIEERDFVIPHEWRRDYQLYDLHSQPLPCTDAIHPPNKRIFASNQEWMVGYSCLGYFLASISEPRTKHLLNPQPQPSQVPFQIERKWCLHSNQVFLLLPFRILFWTFFVGIDKLTWSSSTTMLDESFESMQHSSADLYLLRNGLILLRVT